MEALPKEKQRELIKRVFPELRYGGDPDIERYFDCRRAGRMGEALSIYNGHLLMRYPEDAKRVLLLRLYREGDPRWLGFQEELILDLAGRIAAGIARNIDILVHPLSLLDHGDAYRALAVSEAILRIIPAKDDDALLFLDRYESLALLLRHRAAEMERAQRLLREYVAMTKADSPSEYDFIARSEALEARRREAEARTGRAATGKKETNYDFIAGSEALEARRRHEEEARSRFFDLSRIRFSDEDRARIEIPQAITRKEDRVLAFCWKYWELVGDQGFERMVFLWSKKFGTRHYAIYHSIKIGRLRRHTDDEILTAVSTILSSSYSYSVSGDLYMQASWRRLRANAEAERALSLEAARTGGTSASPAFIAGATTESAPAAASAELPATQTPSPPPREASGKASGKVGGISPLYPEARKAHAIQKPAVRKPEAVRELVSRSGSVSDRIRKLSGKAYDVYKQLFLEQVRLDIHRILLTHRRRAFRLFDDSANQAEDIIYAYMTAHYADPFMNWEESPERAKVESLGYALPSLDPMIESWYRRREA